VGNVHEILIETPESKRLLRIQVHKCEDNIKTDNREIECGVVIGTSGGLL
jgi:hypothetical protein